MAHEEHYSTQFTSSFALEYKQSEHGNILCEMLRHSKELENITYRYCKNLGMVPSKIHCQVIQNEPIEVFQHMHIAKCFTSLKAEILLSFQQ